ncbi:MAG: hypothetical protein LBH43_19785 [Treponema sp.]|nr:hypothetical protein [Treponema sp.]
MYIRNEDKRMVLWVLAVFCFIFLNCPIAKAEDKLTYVKADISHVYYSDVMAKYGDIWIGYTVTDSRTFPSYNGERFIIEKAYYYYRKDGSHVLLGHVDKTGLYDKNGNCLKEVPKIASEYQVAGISSGLIDNILGPSLVLQEKINSDSLWEGNAFVIADIDTQEDTIILMDMSRLLR